MAEKVERFVADVFRIVPVLQHGACGEFVPDFREVVHQLVVGFARLEVVAHVRHVDSFDDIEDEDGVVGRQGASAFGDEVRVGNVVFVGSVGKGIDAVVDVFLYGIVHRTLGVARPRAVIVHTQSATAIHELNIKAHAMELHVELCGFAECRRDSANLRNLRTDMEMDKFQTVAHT